MVLALDDTAGTGLSFEGRAVGSEITGGLDVESTTVVLESWERDARLLLAKIEIMGRAANLLRQVSVHVSGTTNSLETREDDGREKGIVLDLKTTGDGLEGFHRNVAQLSVGVNGQSTSDGSQVWCGETGDGVLVETERSANVVQRWDGQGWDVTEGQILGAHQVGEAGSETVAVGFQNQRLGDV